MGYQNFFATRLYTDIGAADTTITLESAPTVTSGYLVLEARNSTKREIISYTNVSGNDITGVARGVGGTSATTHTQNSLVEMNLTAEDLAAALAVPSDIITRFDEVISDHVASGLVWTDDTGLTADMSAGVAYINGIRLPVSAEVNHAFTASKDTYVDLGDNGVLDYNEVANNAAAPALSASHIRLARVITNATDTTSVTNFVVSSYLERADGWSGGHPVPTTTTYNGNRSYTNVYPTSVAAYGKEGTRKRFTRTVSAPTQCTDLEAGSSQYFNDTSVAGTTFTDDFVCGAWIKLESYGLAGIVTRYNGTSGWQFYILSDGTISLVGRNAAAANFSSVTSYQSIPLGKWVHVTAQLDMSAFTATTTTSYIMIDGVNVPAVVARGGTNPTALVQAGNLEIGSYNGGTNTFDGKIVQAFYSSAKITQANVQTLISQGLTPALISANSIVSAYSLSNDITDLNTTNANNLTANGGATATTVDSPFGNYLGGTLEYGIVTSISSDGLTETIQVPEGCALPTSGGVSAVAYSTQSVPYGFPRDTGRWRIGISYKSQVNTLSNASYGSFNAGGCKITVPVGAWNVGYSLPFYNANITRVTFNLSPTDMTGLSASDGDINFTTAVQASAALTTVSGISNVSIPTSLTSQTSYTVYTIGATTVAGIIANVSRAELFAEFNYL